MVQIYNDPNYQNTYATGAYSTNANAITAVLPNVKYDTPTNRSGTSVTANSILEALFTLNPTIKKKYDGDTKQFADALLAAARAKNDQQALLEINNLGLTEAE